MEAAAQRLRIIIPRPYAIYQATPAAAGEGSLRRQRSAGESTKEVSGLGALSIRPRQRLQVKEVEAAAQRAAAASAGVIEEAMAAAEAARRQASAQTQEQVAHP